MRADKLILPGVGAFSAGMDGLRQRELIEPIQHKGTRPACRSSAFAWGCSCS